MPDIELINQIAIDAGKEILKVYESDDFETEIKDDKSPLTKADRASHLIIKDGLQAAYPEIPLLSEEGRDIPHEERSNWSRFWVVDPLDGTKEFIKRNGEFTVNIALLENGKPVLGVIYAPVLDTLYFADQTVAKKRVVSLKNEEDLRVQGQSKENLTAVRSRSHAAPEEDAFYGQFDIQDTISVGSSLKFCMVAEGKAHLYYRHNPTMEWDTAAGHAIVLGAGGYVYGIEYNKQVLRNTSFYVSAFALSEKEMYM